MAINRVILHGRLTADAELKSTNSGKYYCDFKVAVDRSTKDGGADFIGCIAWEKTAELLAQYFSKGREILVEGRIQTRTYDDKNGRKVYVTEVVADRVDFCGKKTDNEQSAPIDPHPVQRNTTGSPPPQYRQQSFTAQPAPQFEEISNDDDLPF